MNEGRKPISHEIGLLEKKNVDCLNLCGHVPLLDLYLHLHHLK